MPRSLRAGPLSATLDEGALRWIAWDGVEVLRAIHVRVRDRHWGTVPGRLQEVMIREAGDSFTVSFVSVHRGPDVAFRWTAAIAGRADSLEVAMDGRSDGSSTVQRAGICVLHPLAVAGSKVLVVSPARRIEGWFPGPIEPRSPFTDITALDWAPARGVRARLEFEGELFEMEDERNWTDASFKTYAPPLDRPRPMVLGPESRIFQRVRFAISGSVRKRPRPRTADADLIFPGSGPAIALPALGLCVTGVESRIVTGGLRRGRPDHLRIVLSDADPDWPSTLRSAARQASSVGAGLELELVLRDLDRGCHALTAGLAPHAALVRRVLVFDDSLPVTPPGLAQRVRTALRGAGIQAEVGGGSRTHFAQLNRSRVSADEQDVVAYGIDPFVHESDQASLFETIETQAATVKTAGTFVGNRPLAIGPISIGSPDQRIGSAPSAAWIVASLAALCQPGVTSLTYGGRSTVPLERGANGGPPGLLAAVRVFARLHRLDAVAVRSARAPKDVAALWIVGGRGECVLVANLVDAGRTVGVAGGDEASLDVISGHVGNVQQVGPLRPRTDRITWLDLPAWAIVSVHIRRPPTT